MEVAHIPGGCTSLCQLVNEGLNKPFKERIRWLWMVELSASTTAAPTRQIVAERIAELLTEMASEATIVKNACADENGL